ncbi:MAG: caspase family protein [Sulfuritalea sp.]|nr:caspase family protein [Sulfuritalea sp.]
MPRKLLQRLALALAAVAFAGAAWAGNTVTVLYKRESVQSAERTDTAVQAGLAALERELIEAGTAVIQPDAKTYAVLDQAAGVVVTFAADAGLSLLVDAVKTTRPNPGTDNAFAEVRMRARLFHGRRVLAAIAGSGQVGYRIGSEDKAFEIAADRAVRQIIGKVLDKLANAPEIQAAARIEAEADAVPPAADAAPLSAPARKWALLVGVADFSNVRKLNPGAAVGDLKGVKGDLGLVKRTVTGLGIPDKQVKVLLDRDATTSSLRAALKELGAKTGPDDLVVFYVSSHGLPKQEGISGFGYPVTYDTRVNDKSSIIDFEEIQSHLKSMPARKVLWIADTCHAGGATNGLPVVEISGSGGVRLAKSVGGLSIRAATKGIAEKDMAVLAAARDDQEALMDGNGSLFTVGLAAALTRTHGADPIYKIYKDHLETQIPARSREIRHGYSQQPTFGRSGRGDGIVIN